MEAIGQLTGGLAHDFNNMLTVVTGNLQALRQQLGERSEVGDYLDPAMQAAQRGVELIKRLLTFAPATAGAAAGGGQQPDRGMAPADAPLCRNPSPSPRLPTKTIWW